MRGAPPPPHLRGIPRPQPLQPRQHHTGGCHPQGAWKTLLPDVAQGLPRPTPPKLSVAVYRPTTGKHGPSAPQRRHHHPTIRAPGKERAKRRPAAKGQGKAQPEGSTLTGHGSPGALHHKGKQPRHQHKEHHHQGRERHAAGMLRMGNGTGTGTKTNTHREARAEPAGPTTTNHWAPSQRRPTHRARPTTLRDRKAPHGTPPHQGTGPKEDRPGGHKGARPSRLAHRDPAPHEPHPPHRATPTYHRRSHSPRGVNPRRGAQGVDRSRNHNHRGRTTKRQPRPPCTKKRHHTDTRALTPGVGKGTDHNTRDGERHEDRKKGRHPQEENKPS